MSLRLKLHSDLLNLTHSLATSDGSVQLHAVSFRFAQIHDISLSPIQIHSVSFKLIQTLSAIVNSIRILTVSI